MALGRELEHVDEGERAMRTQVNHLIHQHHCQRIAYVGGPGHNEEARQRLAGYRDALAGAQLPVDDALIGMGHFSLATGRAAMVEILRHARDIDAVVGANDYMAMGAMDELVAQGFRVPEDVRVMIDDLLAVAGSSRSLWQSFLGQMIDALAAELSGQSGTFSSCIESIAQHVAEREASLDEVARALVQLLTRCRHAGYHGAPHIGLERACLKALTVLSSAATRREGRRALDVLERAYGLRQVSQGLAMGLDHAGLAQNFVRAIPSIGIGTAYLSVLIQGEQPRMQPLLAYEAGQHLEVDPHPYPAEQLFARGFPSGLAPSNLLLLPLTFEREVLGLVAFGGEGDSFICEAVRSQLSASLKLSALHVRVVEETALRERIARDQLIPKHVPLPELAIVAGMLPADEVGGDYYDIFATPDGCWRNAMHEEFGVERVGQLVSGRAGAPVRDIYDSLLAAVRAWTPVQQDDITMIVLRREY